LPLVAQEEILGSEPLVFCPDGIADDFDFGGFLAEVGDGGVARDGARGRCCGGGGGVGGGGPAVGGGAGVAGGAVFVCGEGGGREEG